MRVGFQGEVGAFSEVATQRFHPDGCDVVPVATFEGLFDALAAGEIDRAVIPIENSLFGSVHRNYD
ncbi:MAG: prephenate dehydratase domain-containing protein, partial [Candidatus Latescibacterota bacterium]